MDHAFDQAGPSCIFAAKAGLNSSLTLHLVREQHESNIIWWQEVAANADLSCFLSRERRQYLSGTSAYEQNNDQMTEDEYGTTVSLVALMVQA